LIRNGISRNGIERFIDKIYFLKKKTKGKLKICSRPFDRKWRGTFSYAIIMDGNGRLGLKKKFFLPSIAGHKEGYEHSSKKSQDESSQIWR